MNTALFTTAGKAMAAHDRATAPRILPAPELGKGATEDLYRHNDATKPYTGGFSPKPAAPVVELGEDGFPLPPADDFMPTAPDPDFPGDPAR